MEAVAHSDGDQALIAWRVARPITRWLLVGALVTVLGCGGGGDGAGSGTGRGGPSFKSLTFMEEQLVGKWSRFHRSDGSYEYFVFKTDRTACYWEVPNGGGRRDARSYSQWELDEANPIAPNVFRIRLTGAGVDHQFHYATREVWQGGYSNLRMTPSTTSESC